jgi:hypothetical protein
VVGLSGRLLAFGAWGLVATGVLARVTRYLADRPLWADEATVALAILERSFGALWVAHPEDPVTPVGFLLLTKAATSLLGSGELALRCVPFVASLVALPVFYAVARVALAADEALGALVLFAILEPVVFYSSECKPYATDVLATLLVLWPGALILRDGASPRRLRALGAAGCLGMFFSLSAVFVVFGLVGALAVAHWRVGWRPVCSLGGLFGLTFGLLFVGVLAPHQEHAARAGWWSTFYAPLSFSREGFAWYGRTFFAFFNDPVGLPAVGVAAVTFVAGSARLGVRSPALLVALTAPIVLAVGASSFELMPFPADEQYGLLDGYYPFFGRVVLYTVPLASLVLAAGLSGWWSLAQPRFGFAGLLGVGCLFAVPVWVLVRNLSSPPVIQDMRALAQQMAPHADPSDLLFTLGYADPVVAYYAPAARLPGVSAVLSARRGEQVEAVAELIESLPAGARFWFATVHHPHWPTRAERDALRPVFSRYAESLTGFESYRGNATLYRRSAR